MVYVVYFLISHIFALLIMPLYTFVLFVVNKMVRNYIRTTSRDANGKLDNAEYVSSY